MVGFCRREEENPQYTPAELQSYFRTRFLNSVSLPHLLTECQIITILLQKQSEMPLSAGHSQVKRFVIVNRVTH